MEIYDNTMYRKRPLLRAVIALALIATAAGAAYVFYEPPITPRTQMALVPIVPPQSDPRTAPQPIPLSDEEPISPNGRPLKIFPESNGVDWFINVTSADPLGQLDIIDRSGDNRDKVIRFYTDRDGKNAAAQLYLHAGQTATIFLPIGVYYPHLATGIEWYGNDIHFGPTGAYWRMAPAVLSRSRSRGSLTTTIYPRAKNGNMTPIALKSF